MSSVSQTLDVLSPFDESLIASVPMQSDDDASKMLDAATERFADRDRWLEPHERIAILSKLAALVEVESEEFALLIAQEGGKPLVDARVEVARAVDGIHLAVKELSHVVRGEEIPMGLTPASEGRNAHTSYEPIGVVVAVSAFNHPLNLIVHQVIPAVAVGCPVIVKPAGTTPLSCLRFVERLHEAGLPEGWCQVCVCDNDVAEHLVTSDRISFFTFIGSARVGWTLKSKLAPGVRCALEHGGAAPVIVDETADLDTVIPSLLKGGFYHAGQVCVSVQRVYVHESMVDALTRRLAEGASALQVGNPSSADTEVGPLILPREVDRVDEWVQEAIGDGAKLVTGGQRVSNTTYTPTVLLDPPANAKVSTREIFGPVVCVYPYSDRGEAITRANALDVAFQAAVYTRDLETARDTAARLDATAVMINDHTAFRVDWMPFAGRRTSGYGIGGIGYTMHDMVQPKMIVTKH
jgi:acyl-CoA reductase-like NAD-dependent aldehyde dehydrogenase